MTMVRGVSSLSITIVLAFCVALPLSPAAGSVGFFPGQVVGNVQSSEINEASGMIASRTHAGVLWTHNDGGDPARFFAMDTQGQLLGTYTLDGGINWDWEDIAIGSGPVAGQDYLYIADIGDNNFYKDEGQWARRPDYKPLTLYRTAEPSVSLGQSPVDITLSSWESVTVEYADSTPRNAESLLVDPVNGDMYIVTKEQDLARIFRATPDVWSSGNQVMNQVAQISMDHATGGDVSPDGDEIILRSDDNHFAGGAFLWSRPDGTDFWDAFDTTPISIDLVWEPQGEAITFDADGVDFFTVSEDKNNEYPPLEIYRYERIPEPTVLMLLGLGGLRIMVRRRKTVLSQR